MQSEATQSTWFSGVLGFCSVFVSWKHAVSRFVSCEDDVTAKLLRVRMLSGQIKSSDPSCHSNNKRWKPLLVCWSSKLFRRRLLLPLISSSQFQADDACIRTHKMISFSIKSKRRQEWKMNENENKRRNTEGRWKGYEEGAKVIRILWGWCEEDGKEL